MAMTLERTLRTATRGSATAAGSKDITHEEFVDALDMVEPAQTPLTSLAANEVALGSIDFKRNVDSPETPLGAVGRADGDAAATPSDATSNIRAIGNIAQGFARVWGVGWQSKKVANIAGVPDVKAYARVKYYAALKQDIEVAIGSFDQVAVYDQGAGLGAIGAGYRKLTDYANRYTAASAFAMGKPTDLHYAPTGACVTGALTSVLTRATLKSIALALRQAAKQKTDWLLVAGLNLRQAISDLTEPSYASDSATGGAMAMAPQQVRVYLRNEQDRELGATVDTIVTDFGRIFVTDSDYIGTTTTTSSGGTLSAVNSDSAQRAQASFVANLNAGLLIKKGNLFKRWAIPPYTETLAADGSGDKEEAKCLVAWGVRNPILAGWLLLS